MADILGDRKGMSKPNVFTADYQDPGMSEKEYADAVLQSNCCSGSFQDSDEQAADLTAIGVRTVFRYLHFSLLSRNELAALQLELNVLECLSERCWS